MAESGEGRVGMKMAMFAHSVWTPKHFKGSKGSDISEKHSSALESCKSGQDPSAVSTWFKEECAGS